MELRKALKSLVALGTGATLVGATVLSALAAASLSTYPAPFIKDGKFDALIVVGANAASIDTLGAIDIATSMQAANTVTKTVPGTSSTVTVEGDAFRLDSGSDFLEKGENINAVGTTTLTSSNLKALAGGKITNAKGSFEYDEQITIPASAADFTVDPDDSSDIPKWFLKFDTAENPYIYKMIFTPALESDITSGVLDDIEDKQITMLGKTYDIVNADGTTGGSITLDLMAGAAKDTITVGETKTYSVGAKDYEVTLTYAETGKAKFTVNGVSTNLIAAGDTDVLSDGTELGLSEVLYQNYAGGIQSAEFYIGATKIRLKDTDINAAVTGDTTVTHGSNTVSDVTTTIAGTNVSTAKINSITLTWLADEDIYIPENGKLSDTSEGNDDNQMFLNFDVEFKGLQVAEKKDTIELTSSGDDEYKLKFTNKAGSSLNVPLIALNGVAARSGSDSYDLIVVEGNFTNSSHGKGAINKNDYFVVSDVTSKYTYLMRYTSIDTTEDTITFQDIGSGTDQVLSYTSLAGTMTLGGADYDFVIDGDVNGANVSVDLDADGTIEELATAPTGWWTKYGANITPPTPMNGASLTIMSEKGGDIVGSSVGETITVNFTNTTSETIELGSIYGAAGLQTIGDGNNKEDYTTWGTHIYQTYAESGPDKLTLTYPDDQTELLAYYTSGATTSTSSTGGTTYQEVVPISVDAAVLDTEVADFSAQNLIVVGGPCVNAAAADAMGSPTPCTTGFVEGKAMIKLYERTNGKVALLVAGYSGMDTRRAARALAEYKKHVFTGTELEVTGTSLTQYTVTAAQ